MVKTLTHANVTQNQFDKLLSALRDRVVLEEYNNDQNTTTGKFTAEHDYLIEFEYIKFAEELSVTIEGAWLTMPIATAKIESLVHPFLDPTTA